MNLFEYSNKVSYSGKLSEFEAFLDKIWQKRDNIIKEEEQTSSMSQRFLDINHHQKLIKAQNYVGVIHYHDETFNLLPKIFEKENNDNVSLDHIQQHIFWWLGYCKRIKFPKYLTSANSMKQDFFEVLIYHFATYTKKLLGSSIYQQYQEVSEETTFLKGRLNSSEYIKKNIVTGNWHKFNCTYDSFITDNLFNQTIKYVSQLLLSVTKQQENRKYLQHILFILDEVSETHISANDCKNIEFNIMMKDFEVIRDYCVLFLENSTIYTNKKKMRLFAFLLPMEYIFENFIYEFIKKELPSINVSSQSQKIKLDTANAYTLKPDLLFTIDDKIIIGDTKYKLIHQKELDKNRPVKQTDLYQMVSYAIRYKTNKIILYYPNTISKKELINFEVMINDMFADKNIEINIVQLPILTHDKTIDFKQLTETLKNEIEQSLIHV